jgi:hypothetical protein
VDKGSRREVPTCARLAIRNAALHDASHRHATVALPYAGLSVTANAINLAQRLECSGLPALFKR